MIRSLEPQLNNKEAKDLYSILANINKPEEMARFLRDLLTIEEIEEAIKRFQGAKMLTDGKTFRDIAAQTGLSSATIARINYWIHHGTGGYKAVLDK